MAAQNALATITSVGSVRVQAEYEAITPVPWMGRHRTASASLTADVSAARYRNALEGRAAGFLDWFIDSSIAMVSTGQVTLYGLSPLRYDSSVQEGAKHRRVLVDYTPGEVLVSVSPKYGDWGFPATTPPQKLEAVDPLTAILNLTIRADATPSNPCGAALRVFDGKQRYGLRLRYSGRVEWDSNAYKGPAIKCDVDYIEIAGFDPKSANRKLLIGKTYAGPTSSSPKSSAASFPRLCKPNSAPTAQASTRSRPRGRHTAERSNY